MPGSPMEVIAIMVDQAEPQGEQMGLGANIWPEVTPEMAGAIEARQMADRSQRRAGCTPLGSTASMIVLPGAA